MKFIPILLKEGRKEDLQKKYFNKFSERTLLALLQTIGNFKSNKNHKYSDFVLKNLSSDFEPDRLDYLEELIDDFDKFQSQLEKKDINQYNNFEEVEKALSKPREKEDQKVLSTQAEKIYEDDNFLVVIPQTQEASCKYGSGTKWCVTQKGTDHFDRYTSGLQKLYFIISKKLSKEPGDYHKIAIHFNELGDEKWWNTKDDLMSKKEETLFKNYFGDVYETIKKHFEVNVGSAVDRKAKLVFQEFDQLNYMRNIPKGYVMHMYFEGFQLRADYPSAQVKVQITNEGGETVLDSSYKTHFTYAVDSSILNLNVVFLNFSNYDEVNLDNWSFKTSFSLKPTTEIIFKQIFMSLFDHVHHKIKNDSVIWGRLIGAKQVWMPDRINYGYTFKKNKGLIKKLIDWLDKDKVGTKLNFLVDIGKLDRKVSDNNSVWYSHPNMNDWHQSPKWRGHFGGFFASAKNAGILDYEKRGNQFLLKKGPNFEAFKKGELKAL